MRRNKNFWILVSLLVAAGVVALYGVSVLTGARADFSDSDLIEVKRGTIVESVVATGKIEPITKVEIKSKANGIIKALRVDVGDLVQQGQVLAELDKEYLEARFREAGANLQSARAALKVARAEYDKNEIEAAGPDVEFFRRTHERAETLFAQRLVSQSDVDKAEADLDLAVNRQKAAYSQLAITRARISQAEANVAQAAAASERAEEELANTTIRAPIRGTVLTRDVEVGSPVSSILNLGAAATLVMTLGNIDRVFVRGQVDESDIGKVRMNLTARIQVETFKDQVFEGRVTQISPIGVMKDNVTTFEVEVSIENPGQNLRANMTANAEIILAEHRNVLILPLSAIAYDSNKDSYVEMPAGESRRRMGVRLGVGDGSKTEILSGVTEGDRVIKR